MIGRGCCQGERVTGSRYHSSRHPKKASRQPFFEYISRLLRLRIMGSKMLPNVASTSSLARKHLDRFLTWGVLTAVPHLRNSAMEAGRYGSPRSAPPCPARSNKHDRGAVTVELNCRSASNSREALRFVLRDETILQVYINPHHNPFHLRVSIQSTQFTKPYHLMIKPPCATRGDHPPNLPLMPTLCKSALPA
jgi:hypothetical protein